MMAGQSVVSLDNVVGNLASSLLCQALERPLVLVRVLGASVVAEIEVRTTWFATGTNLRIIDDLTRRTVVARIDADQERPELRSFRGNPVATVMRERGRYIAACLTIVRAYVAAGRPGRLPVLASYAAWSDLVRSALVWLGRADPCDRYGQDKKLYEYQGTFKGGRVPFGPPHKQMLAPTVSGVNSTPSPPLRCRPDMNLSKRTMTVCDLGARMR